MPSTPGSIVTIPFSQGANTKTDAEALPVGSLTLAENVVFIAPGRLNKRSGLRRLKNTVTNDIPVTGSTGLLSFSAELLHCDGSQLRSWAPTQERWTNRGRLSVASVTDRWVVANTYVQTSPDAVLINGTKCYAYEDSRGGVRVSLKDAATGAVLAADIGASDTAALPRFTSFAGVPLLLLAEGTSVSAYGIDPTGTAQFIADLTGDCFRQVYDAAYTDNDVIVAYASNASNQARVTLYRDSLTSPLWTSAALTQAGAPTAIGVFLSEDETKVWVLSAVNTTLEYAVLNRETGAIVSTGTLTNPAGTVNTFARVTGIANGDRVHVFAEEQHAATADARIDHATISSTYVTSSLSTLVMGHGLVSKAFVQGTEANVNIVSDSSGSTTQSCLFTMASDGHLSTRHLSADAQAKDSYHLAAVNVDSDGSSFFPVERQGAIEVDTNGTNTTTTDDGTVLPATFTVQRRTGINEATLAFGLAPIGVTLSKNLLVAGARGFIYDGSRVVEQGFDQWPEVRATTARSGSVMTPGSYQYAFTYEWTDAQGNNHSSAPSPELNVDNPGGTPIAFTVTNLRTTLKAGVRIVGYRSAVDPTTGTNGLITKQRFTSTSAPTINSPGTDFTTIVDSTSNDQVSVNMALYSSVGELANQPMPACTVVETFKQRVFFAGLDDPTKLAFSKQQTAAREGVPVEFAAELTLATDINTGPITALKAMDDKLVVFKAGAIHVLVGDGPNNTGTDGNDFNTPDLVSSDVGCLDPRSVVLTQNGVMFKSVKGTYMIDRNLGVSYIGAPVEAYNPQAITGATVAPNTNQVRLVSSDGVTQVYDYITGQWSTFSYPLLKGSAVWNKTTYAITDANGRVYLEDTSSFTDFGNGYPLKVTTGWISAAGLLGFQRVRNLWLLGSYKGPHQLTITVEFDGLSAPSYSQTFDVTDIIDATAYGDDSPYGSGSPYGGSVIPYQLGWLLPKQKCRSIRVTVQDSQASDFNEGFSLKAIALEVVPIPGFNRLPNAASR